jgi:hypothetical protein
MGWNRVRYTQEHPIFADIPDNSYFYFVHSYYPQPADPAVTIGETDDFSYNVIRDPVHVHDLNATILHCLGIDHTRLTFKFQGRHFRLTDVAGNAVMKILSGSRAGLSG